MIMLKLDDEYFMKEALKEAQKAFDEGEVPIGAVIVHNNKVIARAHNQMEMLKDATAHAEILAITQAASVFGDWRLTDTKMYVTKEPCPMCAGAMLNSRVSQLVYGVPDKEMGAAGGSMDLLRNDKLRAQLDVKGGVEEDACRNIIQEFFRKQRLKVRAGNN